MAELLVSQKSIIKLFGEMQEKKFIIPDFQRPYKWDVEKCETLWNDIENFSIKEAKSDLYYFLGSIVFYKNGNNLEIIDGQQRITSFFLLLRAFYKKLEDMNVDEDVSGLKNQLAPCIWDVDNISQRVLDKSVIHINSLVITEDDNKILHSILETGICIDDANDNYSLNYRFFKKRCDEYAEANPMQWKHLCVTILKNCIILPIECDTMETALTIFSTLNDRGMPLADSDIFKAQIYRHLETEKRNDFTETWIELTSICKQAHISIDDIFRYYTHVLRARNNDKSKEVGLRKFYAENNFYRLKDENLITEIMALANFWKIINADNKSKDNFKFTISDSARKHLHCLSCYPNDFWKYTVSVFFLKNQDSSTFEKDFCKMLKKLIAFLFAKFINEPSVNAIKDDIYNACITIQNKNELEFRSRLDHELLRQRIDNHSTSKISRALLLLDAYENYGQKKLISKTFDIEHIFPKKWQNTNYNGWCYEDAEKYLNRFGNKIVFEKKLNIQAGNGYFGRKKSEYCKSDIACVVDLSNYHKDDWVKDDIEERETKFKNNILKFFNKHLSLN